jgi:hypothetical protein
MSLLSVNLSPHYIEEEEPDLKFDACRKEILNEPLTSDTEELE